MWRQLCSSTYHCLNILTHHPISFKSSIVYYKGVSNTGIQNDYGYLSASADLLTLGYKFFDMMPVPLCSTVTASSSNTNACPGDGAYTFSFTYPLPNVGNQKLSYLASGWSGKSVIALYAEKSETMMIGKCTLRLKTSLSPGEVSSGSKSIPTPSAAASAAILVGALALIVLSCLYCHCCRKKAVTSSSAVTNKRQSHASPDDVSSFFKTMDDDRQAKPAGYFSSWQTLGANKKTNKPDLA
jgi:hypothetical protein